MSIVDTVVGANDVLLEPPTGSFEMARWFLLP